MMVVRSGMVAHIPAMNGVPPGKRGDAGRRKMQGWTKQCRDNATQVAARLVLPFCHTDSNTQAVNIPVQAQDLLMPEIKKTQLWNQDVAHAALFPGTVIGDLKASTPYMLGRNLMSTDQMLHFDFIGGTYSRLSLVYALHRQAHTQVFPNSCDPQFWPEGSFQFHGEAMEVTTEGPMGHRAVNPTVPTLYVVQPELETGSSMAMFADRTLHCGKRPSPDSFSGYELGRLQCGIVQQYADGKPE